MRDEAFDYAVFRELLFCLEKFSANDAGVGGRLNYSLVKTQTACYHLSLQGSQQPHSNLL